MNKTIVALSAAAMAGYAAAFSSEFLQGAETGIFIQSEQAFEDYNCPMVEMAPQAQTFLDMILPFKMMMMNMNKGEENPMLETLEKVSK